jgi:hypothetical protein
VLKNTVDLEPAEVQEEAREKLDALVLSYQHLDSLLDMAREGNPGGQQHIAVEQGEDGAHAPRALPQHARRLCAGSVGRWMYPDFKRLNTLSIQVKFVRWLPIT